MSLGLIEAAGGTVHWFDAPDGARLRAAHWPNGARGTVLLLNGRGEFMEKYREPIGELQGRGFAVWTMDWRGQGGSSRQLSNPLAHHVNHFDEYLGDLDLLIDRHVLPSLNGRPLVIMAHSMGGNLAARTLARRPELFARGILCSPMIGFWPSNRAGWWLARHFVSLWCRYPGRTVQLGPGAGQPLLINRAFEGNRLTSCRDRFTADTGVLRAAPELMLGPITWGWLRAAMASIATLQKAQTMRRITMPVLALTAGEDRLVDNQAIRRFALRLPAGEHLDIPGARHELLREHDRYRQPAWAAIDKFLHALP